jgi:hypothetical protein
MKYVILILILIAITITLSWKMSSGYSLTPVDKGNVIVYGSDTCKWCIKQKDYMKFWGIPYNFIDCKNEQCPGFVKGFPTILKDDKIYNGYTEL